MADPLAIRMQQAVQAFRVRLLTGDAFRDATGAYDYGTLVRSNEWAQVVNMADAFASAEGLAPFGVQGR